VTRLLLLLLTLSLSTVFIFTPDTEPKDYFLFSDQKLTLETHLFFLFEHLILVILGVVIYIGSTKYKPALFVYIVIQSVDTLIYLLAYGNFRFADIPITWNFIKVFVFSLAIVNEVWKTKQR
jgi:hypothetical protein